MHVMLRTLAAITAAATAGVAHAEEALPGADAFQSGSGRIWFSGCVFEAERYVSCKNAAQSVLDAVAEPGDGTPGDKLQTYVSDLFIEKGCAFEAPPETFRVNGIFLSFDANAAREIRCKGKTGKLIFAPGVISLLDTLYFLSRDPPQ